MKIKRLRRNILFKKEFPVNNLIWAIAYAFLTLICLLQLFIVFWMVYTSLKDDIDLFISVFGLPKLNNLKWENYSTVLSLLRVDIYSPNKGFVTYGFAQMVGNSMLLAICSPIMGIVSTVCTAYVLSKFRFKGREVLIWINMIVMVLPIAGNLASSLKVNYALGRYDNFLLMQLLGHSPFGMGLLIYMGMFNGVDKEYMEAAKIDGAGNFRIFVQIMLPMVKSTIIVFYVLGVLGSWNDYMTPLVWLPSYPNLALGIYQFQYDSAKYAATLPQVLAGFVIISIPSVIFFGCNQKLISSKMMVGGLKG